jgi:hypothetical protein
MDSKPNQRPKGVHVAPTYFEDITYSYIANNSEPTSVPNTRALLSSFDAIITIPTDHLRTI